MHVPEQSTDQTSRRVLVFWLLAVAALVVLVVGLTQGSNRAAPQANKAPNGQSEWAPPGGAPATSTSPPVGSGGQVVAPGTPSATPTDTALGGLQKLLLVLVVVGVLGLTGWLFLRQRKGGATAGAAEKGESAPSRATGSLGSVASFIADQAPRVSFADVAGIDEVRDDLQEVVLFLKEPHRFKSMGARMPRGVLLSGPPGTGKTMLAKAVAGEASVPFLSMNGSEFVEMYVGVGAARVRDLFRRAKNAAPCIVFIDEIDAIGRRRGGGQHSNEEREQALNQILVEMDGFREDGAVVIMAATNRPDILDPALLRPGRFDRRISTELPDVAGRRAILTVHARNKPLAADVDLARLAGESSGMSGADLENLLNEAAIVAARRGAESITAADLGQAFERVIAGPARKSVVFSTHERYLTAVHEAGHALVAHLLPSVEPVRKISIVARGSAGGYTRVGGDGDRRYWTEVHFREQIAFALGGTVAEEIVLGERSTGAAEDLRRANQIARYMVYQCGMSPRVGLVLVAGDAEAPVSPQMLDLAEAEVRRVLEEALTLARDVIGSHRGGLNRLVQELLESDAIEGPVLEEALRAAETTGE